MDLPDLPEPILRALMDVPITEEDWRGEHAFALLDVAYLTAGDVCPLWVKHRHELLRAWIQDRPGTRPQMWWRHDAPRMLPGRFEGWWCDGKLEFPRMRLGGNGSALCEVFEGIEPDYHLGIPVEWIRTPEDLQECTEAGIAATMIDPADPPRFEAQATYLRRYHLLLRGEERRLTPADFEPEVVTGMEPAVEEEAVE